MKPRVVLDLFCGGGGASRGYHDAGFAVVGVDVHPQPAYPYTFVQDDALDVLRSLDPSDYAAIHASPPCPRYSPLTVVSGSPESHPDLVAPVRDLLEAVGLPWIMENVPGSPLRSPTVFCGEAYGLGALCADGIYRPLRRHRHFEASFVILSAGCACSGREPIGVYGLGGPIRHTVRTGGTARGYKGSLDEMRDAMAIDWMPHAAISQAIPPIYTHVIGLQLHGQLDALERAA